MPLYARVWVDILGDPKLRKAEREGAKHLIILPWFLAFAKRADAEGRMEIDGKPADPRDIAAEIPSATPRFVAKAQEELHAIGVFAKDTDGCYRFVAWEYRNSGRASDSREAIAERVRKHRDKRRAKRNADGNASNALQGVTDVTTVTSKRVERREKREESTEKRSKAGSSVKDSLPPAAVEFGRRFYGAAPPERVRDVKRQLRATLNGGALLRKGVRVLAGSPERLEAKCREVIAEGVKDPDRAIVVLLAKLGDVSDDSPTERAEREARVQEDADNRVGAERLSLAIAWLEANPNRVAEIERELDEQVHPDAMPSIRAVLRNSIIARAWLKAGEPIVQPAGNP